MRVRAQFARRRRPSRIWWALACGSLLGALALGVLAWSAVRRTAAVEAELQAAKAKSGSGRDDSIGAAGPAPRYEAHAREVLALHSVLWPRMLTALENAEVPGIRVTSVEYEAASASVRVVVEFVRSASPLALIDQLNAGVPETGPEWRWTLVDIDQRTPGAAGRMVLRGDYSSPGRWRRP